jgi:phosphatidate cytidylyltransferase
MNDTTARVVYAIPAIVFAAFIVAYGGLVFALGLILLGLICLHELYTMTERVRPVKLAGFLGLAGLILCAHYGDQFQILLALALTVPVTFVLSLLRPGRANVSWAIAATLLGVVWIGVALAHAVQLRELDHGGALVLATLIGTFIGDTAAHLLGSAFGRRKLAPRISPAKTVEGLVAGIVVGTGAVVAAAAIWQSWLSTTDALLLGVTITVAAPLGDLFESMLKRSAGVKDSGTLFGAHGGVLDRIDALLFAAPAAYYVSLALL